MKITDHCVNALFTYPYSSPFGTIDIQVNATACPCVTALCNNGAITIADGLSQTTTTSTTTTTMSPIQSSSSPTRNIPTVQSSAAGGSRTTQQNSEITTTSKATTKPVKPPARRPAARSSANSHESRLSFIVVSFLAAIIRCR